MPASCAEARCRVLRLPGASTPPAASRGATACSGSRAASQIITPGTLCASIADKLDSGASEWARLALFILSERHLGQESCWAPYVQSLPAQGSLDSTIFWTSEELGLLKGCSSLLEDTRLRADLIAAEYRQLLPKLQSCNSAFGLSLALDSFKYAYAAVCSRAWKIEDIGDLALVPYVDFLNHNPECRVHLCYDKDEGYAEVIADQDYQAGAQIGTNGRCSWQVMISYGDLPNSVLALDFGFTLPCNPHDHVTLWVDVPTKTVLRKEKLQLLEAHGIGVEESPAGNQGAAFKLMQCTSPAGRGKGIPHGLRAFSRVLTAHCHKDLAMLAAEAVRHEGRLARRPLRDPWESRAMDLLLKCCEDRLDHLGASSLGFAAAALGGRVKPERLRMAKDIQEGHVRILRSVVAWLRLRAMCGGLDKLQAAKG
eukprot:SM000022S07182  [mRNA]  locus=s22:369676:372587:- [translate_table: standard]